MNKNIKVINIAIPNLYVEHGSIDILERESRIDSDSIVNKIKDNVQHQK